MSLWSTSLPPFAGGTGIAISAEQTITPPSQSAQIAFIKHTTAQEAPGVAQSSCTFLRVFGSSYTSTPTELVSNIVGNRLAAINAGATYPARWYEFNQPHPIVNFSCESQNMDSNAGDTEESVDIIWSNQVNGDRIYREFNRAKISTTLTGDNIDISDGLELRDYTFIQCPGGVVVADEEIVSRGTINSTGFGISNSLSQTANTMSIEATSGSTITDINYENVSLPITSQTAIVTSSLAISSDSTNPFSWAVGVGYTKRVNA